jgi:hypothetical protein
MGDHEGSRGKRAGSWEGGRRESPPEAEEGGGKPREGGKNTRGEAEKSRQ